MNKPQLALNSKSDTDINDHSSEAAKVKRLREQAYFNSYDFDAIERLPYSDKDDADDDDDVVANTSKMPPDVTKSTHKTATTKNSQQIFKQKKKQKLNQYTISSNDGLSHHHNQLHQSALAKYRLTLPHPLSPKSRQRLQNASLSSLSNSSGIPSSGSVRSSSSYTHSHSDMKSGYLQRLGAFLIKAHNDGGQQKNNRSSSSSSSSRNVSNLVGHIDDALVGVHTTAGKDDINGNFLLPRAMLKYHSVGTTNSMPLAVITAAAQSGTNKFSQNANNNNNNHKTTMMMTSSEINGHRTHTTTRLSYSTVSGVATSAAAAAAVGAGAGAEAVIGIEENSGFLPISTTTVTATIEKSSITTQPTRKKKESTSSTITTDTTESLVSEENEKITSSNSNDEVHGSRQPTTILGGKAKTTTLATVASPNAKVAHQKYLQHQQQLQKQLRPPPLLQRGRANSHQSHYSTDKSGSSGYYSSNVCSTYSLDDHIYSEPVIDIVDLNSKSKSVVGEKRSLQPATNKLAQKSKVELDAVLLATSTSQSVDMNGVGQSKVLGDCEDDDDDDDDDDAEGEADETDGGNKKNQAPHLSDNLRILEASIENLDRHLRSFPSLSSQEHIVSYVQLQNTQPFDVSVEKSRSHTHLPTIVEGYDTSNHGRPWPVDIIDDSLLDIDLDSFLLVDERKNKKRILNTPDSKGGGIDNPSFLTDEEEENHYKCAKYINSCPEDAYRVESDIVAGSNTNASVKSISVEHYLKRYEDQIHFQNTRELLEDVREKIRLVSRGELDADAGESQSPQTAATDEMPKELETMIKTLKGELESYLDRMNKHSEMEIRQLCSGLVKNQNIVKMKKAFERRASSGSLNVIEPEYEIATYEAVKDVTLIPAWGGGACAGIPVNIRQQLASIRCTSDPNFKMKRKSIAEIFPTSACCIETISEERKSDVTLKTQLQRNLSFHKPVLDQLETRLSTNVADMRTNSGYNKNAGGPPEEAGDKDSILEWHRKKPSIWEMYYGTNRMNQSLLGKRNGMVVNHNAVSMSYPSSRPESDFTLDLPRAEQLRIKMEKEKKFRQRCRYITTFLSLVFFLLTVMVVSLVLTRGKRMFGSMI